MRSLWIAATLVITVFELQLALSGPVSKRSVWMGGALDRGQEEEGSCHSLPEDLADYCGYNVTYFEPNRRLTFVGAKSEFNHFILLLNSGCSEYLGTYLCFHYFPFTNCKNGSLIKPVLKILPCKETCEAAQNDNCTALITTHGPGRWARHLNCNLLKSRSEEPLCAFGENFKRYTPGTAPVPPVTNAPTETTTPTERTEPEKTTTPTERTEPEKTTTPTERTEPEKTTTPTKAPSEETTEEVLPDCPKTCNIRTKANSGTFVRNTEYTFAIKATVTRRVGQNKYQVQVVESFPLQTCNKATGQLDSALVIGDSVIVKNTYEHCPNEGNMRLSSKIGQEVLIAGSHKTETELELIVDCSKRHLVADWTKKYTNKLRSWVLRGNKHRGKECVP